MQSHRNKPNLSSIAAYLVCIALICTYVQMFPVWKLLSSRFGDSPFIYLPIIISIILVCLLVVYSNKRRPALSPSYGAIIFGVLLCTVGLLIPDPAYPVKRIHVAEYLLLALIARYAMAPFMRGIPLLLFASCFAAILGVHDEFLQGIHPARTYGLRDMTVNALASFGGGLIGHGLSLFPQMSIHTSESPMPPIQKHDGFYPCWLVISVVMLVVPAIYFRGMIIDAWTIVPLIGSMAIFTLYRRRFRKDYVHGIFAMSCAAWSLCCYPFISSLEHFVFY